MSIRYDRFRNARYLPYLTAFLMINASTVANAQMSEESSGSGGVADIVVTANKRGAESLLKVPASISAVSSDSLARSGAQSIQDYAQSLPGLAVFDAGPNQKRVKIRGVSGSSDSEPQETVGIYLDDVSITSPGGTNNENNASPDLNLFDIERVEVLKGPQGTLYGAGSMGGTIRFITKKPKLDKVEGEVQGRLSSTKSGDASYSGDAVINLPLVTDTMALRLVGTYRNTGGYIDNASTDFSKKNYNNDSSWLVRGTLLYKPADTVEIALKYLHREVTVNGLNSVPRGNKLISAYLVEPHSDADMDIINSELNVDLGGATLSSSTSYLDRRDLGFRDLTPLGRAYIGVVSGFAEPAPPLGLYNKQAYHEFAQELRLASDNSHKMKYVVGAYYSKQVKRFTQDGPWPGFSDYLTRNGAIAALAGKVPFQSPVLGITDLSFYSAVVDQDLRQLALFGELTYSFTDQLDLTIGGRYFDISQHSLFDADDRSMFVTTDASYRKAALKEDGFNPKATLSFKPKQDVLLYATVAKGFRPGGFNQPVSTNAQCLAEFQVIGFNPNDFPGFKSDSLMSYEVGAKGDALNKHVQFTASAYQIDWKDIQLRNQLQCGFTVFDTASKAKIKGLEGSLTARPTRDLTLSVNGAYTDAKLLSASMTTGGIAGDRLVGVPKFTLAGSIEYEMPLSGDVSGYLRTDAMYVSTYKSFFSTQILNGAIRNRDLGDFAIVNARVGAFGKVGEWEAQIFVNNVLNKLGDTGAQNDIFGDVVFRTRPREIGVQVSKRF
ncbi:MAG: TonB-dependent receptor [Sphingomonadaceae bacterium]